MFKLQLTKSIPQSLRDSSLYTREPKCSASILQLLISLPLTREVARRSRDGGREKINKFCYYFIAVPWDVEDAIPYNLLKTRQIKVAGASPRPTWHCANVNNLQL